MKNHKWIGLLTLALLLVTGCSDRSLTNPALLSNVGAEDTSLEVSNQIPNDPVKPEQPEKPQSISNPSPIVKQEGIEKQWEKDIMPIDPSKVIGMTIQQLFAEKGEGKKDYGYNADGKFLSAIEYKETWFQWKEPARAQYIINNNKVMQITLTYEKSTKVHDLIKQISSLLGEGEQRKEIGAPSSYSAHWKTETATFDLQYFDTYTEIYIFPTR
ncbi:hypothetical protein NW801_18815 [Brevibacillus laterosporus]|uniref:Lipoprotein n=2 Tax=Brevibacillus TaxID=55080 RepID=A0A0F7EFU4_BRELA|nr:MULTISPECIES: hypothetical protein [Brevibacillus]AKF92823.1 hypothetical protein EX87_03475 [Brevibacillus laterosporus]MCR8987069.1 hypothetical protein [Brevibacillus laterosporus]MCZ0832806.1 hypothetical protein [Brevibacillus halotolerans]